MFEAAINAAAEAAPHQTEPVALVPGLQLHVDGDYLAYYASGNEDTTPGEARLNAISLIEVFRAAVGAEAVVMHNTAKGCHKGERYLIATVKPYQAQRVDGRKPKNHGYLQNWLQGYEGPLFRAKNWTSREADDGIAACAHFAVGREPGYIAIATADKDMRMLPGLHLNWKTRQLTTVSPGAYDVMGEDDKQYGLKFFFQQMLMGDAADNCPGLEKYEVQHPDGSFKALKPCGEKTAIKLLEGCTNVQEALDVVLQLYRGGYHGQHDNVPYDRFVEQAGLLWMRCGLDASVTDFATHKGASAIPYPTPILEAAKRLQERVTLARTAINALADSDCALRTDSLAA
jgi:DNA polymerase-1